MTRARRNAFGLLLLLICACILLAFTYQPILRNLGEYLVESQAPDKADAVLVLAGDMRGIRILHAAELVKAGYAPVALVSGPYELYGVNEAELAIQFAVRRGASPAYFEAVPINAFSTLEEARAFTPVLRKRNIRTLLLVTSNYHTRRAAETFRRILGPSISIRPIAASDPFFDAGSWWQNREGQKTVFYEYSKTLANWIGL